MKKMNIFKGVVVVDGKEVKTTIIDDRVCVDLQDIYSFWEKGNLWFQRCLSWKDFKPKFIHKKFISFQDFLEIIDIIDDMKMFIFGYKNYFYKNSVTLKMERVDRRLKILNLKENHPAHHPQYFSRGVFAKEDINDVPCKIGYYTGVECDLNKIDFTPDTLLVPDAGLSYNATSHGNETRYINDYRNIADEPNCKYGEVEIFEKDNEIFKIVPIIIIKPIKKGEELLLDYGEEYWDRLEKLNNSMMYPHPKNIKGKKRSRKENNNNNGVLKRIKIDINEELVKAKSSVNRVLALLRTVNADNSVSIDIGRPPDQRLATAEAGKYLVNNLDKLHEVLEQRKGIDQTREWKRLLKWWTVCDRALAIHGIFKYYEENKLNQKKSWDELNNVKTKISYSQALVYKRLGGFLMQYQGFKFQVHWKTLNEWNRTEELGTNLINLLKKELMEDPNQARVFWKMGYEQLKRRQL